MDPFCTSTCLSTPENGASAVEVNTNLPFASPMIPMARANSASEMVAANMDKVVQLMHKPEQLLATLKLQQAALEATVRDLELSVLESQSAVTQLNHRVSEIRRLEESGDQAGLQDMAVRSRITAFDSGKLENKNTAELLEEQAVPVEDGTLLGKIYGEQMRKQQKKRWPSRKEGILPFARGLSRMVVDNAWFECIISFVIVVNSVMLGVESQMSLSGNDVGWSWTAEIFFLVIFSGEILLRLIANGWKSFRDGWFVFDLSLVLTAYVEQTIQFFTASRSEQQVLVLRTMRLFRLIRTFRMIKQIKSVWRLVHGLITCGETIISTFLLLFIVLYVFGVMGLELIRKDDLLRDDDNTHEIVMKWFSNLGVCIMTLTQFVTMDTIGDIYAPLVKQKPFVLGLYFTLLVIIVSISLMNLVTAVLVEGALEHARQEKEEETRVEQATTKQLVPEIISLFDLIDEDGSGEVDLTEMVKFEEDGLVPSHLLDRASVDSMADLFNTLDVDGSGKINRSEFIEGLLNIFLREVPVSTLQMLKMQRLLRDKVTHVEEDVLELQDLLSVLRAEPRI